MELSPALGAWLIWSTHELTRHSALMLISTALLAIVPVLVALMMRDRIAVLCTGLLSLGVFWLSTGDEINWTALSVFEATAALGLALAAIGRGRADRVLHDHKLQELNGLKARVKVLEACEQRRVMQSLNRPLTTAEPTELMTASEGNHASESEFPVVPKMMPDEAGGDQGARSVSRTKGAPGVRSG